MFGRRLGSGSRVSVAVIVSPLKETRKVSLMRLGDQEAIAEYEVMESKWMELMRLWHKEKPEMV